MLSVRGLSVEYGAVTAVDRVDLDVADGAVLALLGPSGCGKSTLLRAVAGLEPPAAGTVSWDGTDLARIPVHRRGFGLMFQEGVLFPHRTVAGNVGYGLRRTPDADARVTELLEMVGLAGFGPRRVATLSGGQAQRVALARALAPRPRLLLLDEPLAALDAALREQLLADLRAVFTATGTTAIFVTHDQSEAFAVADTVAVMRAGAIVQAGRPGAVWSRPADEWVARFLGCAAVIPARPRREPDGSWCSVTALGPVPGRAGQVGLRPAALRLDAAGALRGTVRSVVPGPESHRVGVHIDGATPVPDEVPATALAGERVRVGETVRLRWDPDGAVLVGPPGGEAPGGGSPEGGAPGGDGATGDGAPGDGASDGEVRGGDGARVPGASPSGSPARPGVAGGSRASGVPAG